MMEGSYVRNTRLQGAYLNMCVALPRDEQWNSLTPEGIIKNSWNIIQEVNIDDSDRNEGDMFEHWCFVIEREWVG